ncbi:unnamed protein product, partial [Ascophyllum nodosum]
WYVCTKQLQLVSLELCVTCRKLETSCIVVTTDTPPHLWRRQDVENYARDRGHSRLPALRVSAIIWKRSGAELLKGSEQLEMTPTELVATSCNDRDRLDAAWSPPSRQQLQRLPLMPEALNGVVWPASLLQLTFGAHFNLSIESVAWPGSLEYLKFGDAFNQPIAQVVWPPVLRQVVLGRDFNMPIESVVWPNSLQHLSFGYKFNQAVARVVWPTSLLQLTFGAHFNFSTESVVWPVSLKYLEFGDA